MRRAALVPLVALALALVLAGCTGEPESVPEVDSPLADCSGLTEPPAGGTGTGGPTGDPLPELTLPCLTGGEPFALADLRGPAVVNLWASWCTPCRAELPELQRYADRAAGQVHVLGVVTRDRPAAAAALATDLGITFPALADRDGQLHSALPGMSLPVTLFVDEAGAIAYLHPRELDEDAVAGLVADHLGVA